jgi:hypothetical protein
MRIANLGRWLSGQTALERLRAEIELYEHAAQVFKLATAVTRLVCESELNHGCDQDPRLASSNIASVTYIHNAASKLLPRCDASGTP